MPRPHLTEAERALQHVQGTQLLDRMEGELQNGRLPTTADRAALCPLRRTFRGDPVLVPRSHMVAGVTELLEMVDSSFDTIDVSFCDSVSRLANHSTTPAALLIAPEYLADSVDRIHSCFDIAPVLYKAQQATRKRNQCGQDRTTSSCDFMILLQYLLGRLLVSKCEDWTTLQETVANVGSWRTEQQVGLFFLCIDLCHADPTMAGLEGRKPQWLTSKVVIDLVLDQWSVLPVLARESGVHYATAAAVVTDQLSRIRDAEDDDAAAEQFLRCCRTLLQTSQSGSTYSTSPEFQCLCQYKVEHPDVVHVRHLQPSFPLLQSMVISFDSGHFDMATSLLDQILRCDAIVDPDEKEQAARLYFEMLLGYGRLLYDKHLPYPDRVLTSLVQMLTPHYRLLLMEFLLQFSLRTDQHENVSPAVKTYIRIKCRQTLLEVLRGTQGPIIAKWRETDDAFQDVQSYISFVLTPRPTNTMNKTWPEEFLAVDVSVPTDWDKENTNLHAGAILETYYRVMDGDEDDHHPQLLEEPAEEDARMVIVDEDPKADMIEVIASEDEEESDQLEQPDESSAPMEEVEELSDDDEESVEVVGVESSEAEEQEDQFEDSNDGVLDEYDDEVEPAGEGSTPAASDRSLVAMDVDSASDEIAAYQERAEESVASVQSGRIDDETESNNDVLDDRHGLSRADVDMAANFADIANETYDSEEKEPVGAEYDPVVAEDPLPEADNAGYIAEESQVDEADEDEGRGHATDAETGTAQALLMMHQPPKASDPPRDEGYEPEHSDGHEHEDADASIGDMDDNADGRTSATATIPSVEAAHEHPRQSNAVDELGYYGGESQVDEHSEGREHDEADVSMAEDTDDASRNLKSGTSDHESEGNVAMEGEESSSKVHDVSATETIPASGHQGSEIPRQHPVEDPAYLAEESQVEEDEESRQQIQNVEATRSHPSQHDAGYDPEPSDGHECEVSDAAKPEEDHFEVLKEAPRSEYQGQEHSDGAVFQVPQHVEQTRKRSDYDDGYQGGESHGNEDVDILPKRRDISGYEPDQSQCGATEESEQSESINTEDENDQNEQHGEVQVPLVNGHDDVHSRPIASSFSDVHADDEYTAESEMDAPHGKPPSAGSDVAMASDSSLEDAVDPHKTENLAGTGIGPRGSLTDVAAQIQLNESNKTDHNQELSVPIGHAPAQEANASVPQESNTSNVDESMEVDAGTGGKLDERRSSEPSARDDAEMSDGAIPAMAIAEPTSVVDKPCEAAIEEHVQGVSSAISPTTLQTGSAPEPAGDREEPSGVETANDEQNAAAALQAGGSVTDVVATEEVLDSEQMAESSIVVEQDDRATAADAPTSEVDRSDVAGAEAAGALDDVHQFESPILEGDKLTAQPDIPSPEVVATEEQTTSATDNVVAEGEERMPLDSADVVNQEAQPSASVEDPSTSPGNDHIQQQDATGSNIDIKDDAGDSKGEPHSSASVVASVSGQTSTQPDDGNAASEEVSSVARSVAPAETAERQVDDSEDKTTLENSQNDTPEEKKETRSAHPSTEAEEVADTAAIPVAESSLMLQDLSSPKQDPGMARLISAADKGPPTESQAAESLDENKSISGHLSTPKRTKEVVETAETQDDRLQDLSSPKEDPGMKRLKEASAKKQNQATDGDGDDIPDTESTKKRKLDPEETEGPEAEEPVPDSVKYNDTEDDGYESDLTASTMPGKSVRETPPRKRSKLVDDSAVENALPQAPLLGTIEEDEPIDHNTPVGRTPARSLRRSARSGAASGRSTPSKLSASEGPTPKTRGSSRASNPNSSIAGGSEHTPLPGRPPKPPPSGDRDDASVSSSVRRSGRKRKEVARLDPGESVAPSPTPSKKARAKKDGGGTPASSVGSKGTASRRSTRSKKSTDDGGSVAGRTRSTRSGGSVCSVGSTSTRRSARLRKKQEDA